MRSVSAQIVTIVATLLTSTSHAALADPATANSYASALDATTARLSPKIQCLVLRDTPFPSPPCKRAPRHPIPICSPLPYVSVFTTNPFCWPVK